MLVLCGTLREINKEYEEHTTQWLNEKYKRTNNVLGLDV
jgi:hypothetical protein